jgi:hypothetical protein
MYVDNLITKLQENDSTPVQLNDIVVGGMFYADDLVIMSTTEAGLQLAIPHHFYKYQQVISHYHSMQAYVGPVSFIFTLLLL